MCCWPYAQVELEDAPPKNREEKKEYRLVSDQLQLHPVVSRKHWVFIISRIHFAILSTHDIFTLFHSFTTNLRDISYLHRITTFFLPSLQSTRSIMSYHYTYVPHKEPHPWDPEPKKADCPKPAPQSTYGYYAMVSPHLLPPPPSPRRT